MTKNKHEDNSAELSKEAEELLKSLSCFLCRDCWHGIIDIPKEKRKQLSVRLWKWYNGEYSDNVVAEKRLQQYCQRFHKKEESVPVSEFEAYKEKIGNRINRLERMETPDVFGKQEWVVSVKDLKEKLGLPEGKKVRECVEEHTKPELLITTNECQISNKPVIQKDIVEGSGKITDLKELGLSSKEKARGV